MAADQRVPDGEYTPLTCPRIGSLCTGYGGLDLAIERVLGARTVWTAEFDKFARQVTEARFPVPNHGDIKTTDWSAVEPIDVLTAGYPCQPFSRAGKRQGADDARHLWPAVRDAIRDLRPRLVVLENVKDHLSLGFDEVLGDLASLGLDAEWTVLRASDVGACHQRPRLFVLAADPDVPRLQGHGRHDQRDPEVPERHVPAQVDFPSDPWAPYIPALTQHGDILGRPAPAAVDENGRHSALFVEWMMMLPEGWVTDILSRSQAVRVLGNGVVPLCAEVAVNHLIGRFAAEEVAA